MTLSSVLLPDPLVERSTLTEASPPTFPLRSALTMWHLCSLDAPSVAVSWLVFVAWAAGIRLPWSESAAMFLAVWLLYVADRLLDARPLFTAAYAPELRERHAFHERHRTGFLITSIFAFVALMVALVQLREEELAFYAGLTVLLLCWLSLVHGKRLRGVSSHRLPKEFTVGCFFSVAVFLPTLCRAAHGEKLLVAGAFLFGLICSLNCLFLYRWEHGAVNPQAHLTTRRALPHLISLTQALVLLSMLLALGSLLRRQPLNHGTSHINALFFATALSSAALLLLHRARYRLAPLVLRSLADVALLSPWPWLLVALGRHLWSA